MHRLYIFLTLCLLPAGSLHAQTPSRYPNELPEFCFYESATWRVLTPLVSTMADVRKALGKPAETVDIAHYDSYPGDEAAECPLFVYEYGKDWKLYIYFGGPNMTTIAGGTLPESVHRRLFSIDLLSREPRHFPQPLPIPFVRKPTMGADAAWDEFSDGSGLRYDVYTDYTPFGKTSPGDLNRISYGPSAAELARVLHK